MPHVFCAGGTILIPGPRYDLRKVLDAYEQVIDVLTERIGGGRSTVSTTREQYREHLDWPDPGKGVARETWLRMAELYEAVDEPLVHAVGGMTAKAYLLGKTWCVYHRERDLITTPTGLDLSELDPHPVIGVYGPEVQDNSYQLCDAATIAAVRGLLAGPLAGLGLEMTESQILTEPSDPSRPLQIAFIDFPHAGYGDGFGPIRVRCVTPDGTFVKANTESS